MATNGNVYPKVVIQMSDSVRIEATAPISKEEHSLLMTAIDGLSYKASGSSSSTPQRRRPGRPRKTPVTEPTIA